MKRRPDLLRLLAILIIILGMVYFYLNLFLPARIPAILRLAVIERPLNILILGTDLTFDLITGRATTEVGRTDTILLLHFDPLRQKANLLSIPRDSYVEIPGYGFQKINAAYVWGKTELALNTVEKLTAVKIDKYLLINTKGLNKLVDLLGGVKLYVDKDMYYVDRAQDLYINLKAGWQKLSGKDAEGYIRFRHDALADLGRIERQQKFLKALTATLATPQALLKSPFIIGLIRNNIRSNLSLKQFILLANTFRMMNLKSIYTDTVPGVAGNNEAGSVWLIDRAGLKQIISRYF